MSGHGEGQPAESLVGVQVIETLQWCLQVFVKQDEAMAALHLSATHYAPITFSVAEALHTIMEYQPPHYWPPGTQEMVDRVMSHLGMYDDSPRSPHQH